MKALHAATAYLAALALAACGGHTHMLIPEENAPGPTAGVFSHEGREGPTMVLEFAGKRFEAHGFAIQRNQNLAELRKRYGSGKHYDRISSGFDSDHYVYSAEPELRAADGAALSCSMAWRAGGVPVGSCATSDGAHIEVRFN